MIAGAKDVDIVKSVTNDNGVPIEIIIIVAIAIAIDMTT